ncbi:MAG: beta-ketoacyl-ACP synthase III [Steroidobacteraceae bacterium]
MVNRYSRVAGTGSYLPEKILTNADVEKLVDTSDEWIRTRTGIERRHIAADNETSSSMAEHAARRALKAAGQTPADVDFIVVGTCTPDLIFPNTGTLLQQRLDIHGCPAFSLETACSGFIYALSIADKYVRLGEAKCALVVGVECLSRITDWSDRATAVLFGDGAGAVVLTPADEPGVIGTHLHSDGRYKDLLYFPFGVSKGFDKLRAGETAGITMLGNEVFKVAVRTLSRLVDETLAKNGIERGQIDWLIPHQANLRIIQSAADKLGLPMEKVVVTVQDHGNTSAASIPLALDTAIRDGRIHRGQTLLLETFGGGFTWGSALVRY